MYIRNFSKVDCLKKKFVEIYRRGLLIKALSNEVYLRHKSVERLATIIIIIIMAKSSIQINFI